MNAEQGSADGGFERSIERVAHAAFAGIVNHLIGAESWARDRLAPHAGKAVKLSSPPFSITLAVMDSGLLATASHASVPDVELLLPFTALPRIAADMLNAGDTHASVLPHMRIEGDADLAQAVGLLFQHLRWEPEDDLSRMVGDAAAHRFAEWVRDAWAQAREANGRLLGNAVEYLTHEQTGLVPTPQLAEFDEQVARLREDLERLDKRIGRLR